MSFVTGHTGFKGSWLSLWLQALGAEVTGYALAPAREPAACSSSAVSTGCMHSVIADIRDARRSLAAEARSRPEVVFHLAAQAMVRESYATPVETYATNVMGTAHLLEAVRSRGDVAAVVNVTSDKCYENREWVWGYRETDPLGGIDPYSSSKAAAELVTAAYRASYFNPAHACAARSRDRHGAGRQRHRWRGLRTRTGWCRTASAALGGGEPVRSATRRRPGRGSTCSSRCRVICSWPGRLHGGCRTSPSAWNFGPADGDARPVAWIVDRFCRALGGRRLPGADEGRTRTRRDT